MPGDDRPSERGTAPPAVRELLGGIIDYAGLFPPAQLEMRAAVENYASYRAGTDAWALGRFVVAAGRLEEFAAAVASLGGPPGQNPWRLGALLGPDAPRDLERIRAFNEGPLSRAKGAFAADVVELRVASAEEIVPRVAEIPATLTAYVEVPVDRDPRELVGALRRAGARAKVRTGGVTAEMFPPPDELLRFLRACVEADLPFKATAGLHHPVAGRYPLTYARDSPIATMYGYLNLIFATALLRRGAPEDSVAAALGETDATAFDLADDAVSWREYRLSRDEVRAVRERGMVAFGSCSFREPLDELVTPAGRGLSGAPHPANGP